MKLEKWLVAVFFIMIIIIVLISWISDKDRIILNLPQIAFYEAIDDLKFSPDGNFLVVIVKYSGLYEKKVGVWHLETRTFQEMREYDRAYITSVAFSPDSQKLVITIAEDLEQKFAAGIVLWDVITGQKQEIKIDTPPHRGRSKITASSFNSKGMELAAAYFRHQNPKLEQFIQIFQWPSLNAEQRIQIEPVDNKSLVGDTYMVRQLTYSPDGKYLAGKFFERIMLWDMENGVTQTVLGSEYVESIGNIAFSPDGRYLAAATDRKISEKDQIKGVIDIWEVASGKLYKTLHKEGDKLIAEVAYSPDGKYVAAYAPRKNSVRIWDIEEEKIVAEINGPGEIVTAIAYSPTEKYLAIAGITTPGQGAKSYVELQELPIKKKE